MLVSCIEVTDLKSEALATSSRHHDDRVLILFDERSNDRFLDSSEVVEAPMFGQKSSCHVHCSVYSYENAVEPDVFPTGVGSCLASLTVRGACPARKPASSDGERIWSPRS